MNKRKTFFRIDQEGACIADNCNADDAAMKLKKLQVKFSKRSLHRMKSGKDKDFLINNQTITVTKI